MRITFDGGQAFEMIHPEDSTHLLQINIFGNDGLSKLRVRLSRQEARLLSLAIGVEVDRMKVS